jgi:hypothetical protein
MRPSAQTITASLLLAACGLLLAVALGSSVDWRMSHDTPILLYMAFLMDAFEALPHRDFFDMNLLGTYGTYRAVGALLGYSDLAVRVAELGILGVLLTLSHRFMRPFGRPAAWAGVVLPGLCYLSVAGGQALQRELLLLPPLLGAALLCLREGWPGPHLRALAVGSLVGLAMTVKPQAAIVAPALLLALPRPAAGGLRAGVTQAALGALGMSLMPTLAMLWLLWHGVLDEFLRIFHSYLPLYGEIGGGHRLAHGTARLERSLRGLLAPDLHWAFSIPAALGLLVHARGPQGRRALLLAGLLLAAWLYPAFPGQFWTYHWIPLAVVAGMAAGLCLQPPAGVEGNPRAWLRLGVLILGLLPVLQPWTGLRPVLEDRSDPPKNGRPDRIAAYLQEHMEPGDTVQPLDWAGCGVVHGLLLARARPATRWMYDFHFHHHVGSPTIQGMRTAFLQDLDAAQPRFLVWGHTVRPYLRGPDTEPHFEALEAWRDAHYEPALDTPGFTIWERRAPRSLQGGE